MSDRLKRIFQSMHFRLLIILLLVGLVPANIMLRGVLTGYEKQSVSMRASMIRNQCLRLSRDLFATNYLDTGSSDVVDSALMQIADLYGGRVIVVNGSFCIIRDTYGLDEGKTVVAKEVIECFKGLNSDYYNAANDFIEVVSPIQDDVTRNVEGAFIVSIPTTDIIQSREYLSRSVLLLQILVTILVIGVSFYASRLLVKPFGKVTAMMNSSPRTSRSPTTRRRSFCRLRTIRCATVCRHRRNRVRNSYPTSPMS